MTKPQYELKKLMQLRLAEMQAKNPQFSLRAYAKSLDIHAASLSEFFSGKRMFSPKLQKKIIEKLQISPEKKHLLLNLLETDPEATVTADRLQIDNDSYFLVTDPIYYSLLCLIEIEGFRDNSEWIAGRLNRTPEEAVDALQRLERVGYVKRLENGKLIVTDVHLMTSDDIANTALRLRHNENLESAKHALNNLPVKDRYFRFETLAIDTENMATFKQAAQEFINKAVSLSQKSSTKNEVYEFCLNFFPRSNVENLESVNVSTCYKKTGTVFGTACSKMIEKNNAASYNPIKKTNKNKNIKELQ